MKPISRRVDRVYSSTGVLSITAVKLNKFHGEWLFLRGRDKSIRQERYDRVYIRLSERDTIAKNRATQREEK